MKTSQEVINSHTALRVLSGLLAGGGLAALVWRAYRSLAAAVAPNWLEILSSLGVIYGIYLFGYFAFKGRLPFRHGKSGNA